MHRLAWENIAWDDRVCLGCDRWRQKYVLAVCGLFAPERLRLSGDWGIDRFINTIMRPKSVPEATTV